MQRLVGLRLVGHRCGFELRFAFASHVNDTHGEVGKDGYLFAAEKPTMHSFFTGYAADDKHADVEAHNITKNLTKQRGQSKCQNKARQACIEPERKHVWRQSKTLECGFCQPTGNSNEKYSQWTDNNNASEIVNDFGFHYFEFSARSQAARRSPTTKLTRRRKGARNERTVGGRVQRLVVPMLGNLVTHFELLLPRNPIVPNSPPKMPPQIVPLAACKTNET